MKLLITGGAGFIGANFIHYWLAQHPSDEIVNLDLLTYAGNLNNLHAAADNPRYTFVRGDIRDSAVVDPLVAAADIIVHFAAETHVDRSIQNPSVFVDTNVQGTLVLLEAVRRRQRAGRPAPRSFSEVGHAPRSLGEVGPAPHFHHISTDEVFGALPLNSVEKFTEQTVYRPSSPYSASKAAADHLVRAYHETFGLPITITNCSNNFGPYQYPEKFIPRMITNLLDGANARIYGDGLYVRDWLYVTDHCHAIDLILRRGKIGETYLAGGMTEDVNNLQVAKLLLEYLGLGEERIDFVTDRPGHDRRYAV
ncbi:MAG: dTDP-glucose 4,6-dehydratase, partial [Candidatus Andersenbacteria bacterium]|nr:dTDP-glucose 4,6-dehydratase [Candidatus Andersenbacteria bacterium]